MSLEALLVILVGVGGGAMCKGITGMGLPLIALPVMATFIDVPHAIVILMVPAIVSNLWQIVSFRAHRTFIDFLPRMIFASAVGIGLGTLFLKTAPGPMIYGFLGAMLLAYIALRLINPHFVLAIERARSLSAPAFLCAGAMQGGLGIATPIVVTFMNAMRLDRPVYIFVISSLYLSFASVQLTALVVAGLVKPAYLVEGALALLPLGIFMPLGARLARHLNGQTFDRVLLVILFIIAIRFLAVAISPALSA